MNTEAVVHHYARKNSLQVIKDNLSNKGINFENATLEDISAYDEFHIGGHDATQYFVEKLNFQPSSKILDVGSGVGGPARFFANHFGCHVTGIDLTPDFVNTAKVLSQQTDMSSQTDFIQGNACDMPFEDQSFDGVTLMHASMNIPDKDNLYKQVNRCLKKGGIFAMYDVLSPHDNPEENMRFPVPWADGSHYSKLTKIEALKADIKSYDFVINYEEDRSAYAIEYLTELIPVMEKKGEDGLIERFENLISNIRDNLCMPVIIIAQKT